MLELEWKKKKTKQKKRPKKKDQAYEDRKTKEDRKIEIKANGEILEWVSKYIYLGSTISGDEMGWRK